MNNKELHIEGVFSRKDNKEITENERDHFIDLFIESIESLNYTFGGGFSLDDVEEPEKTIISDKYPDTIEGCLKILETIKYESSGFPMIFLDYHFGKWGVTFRNPVNFKNQDWTRDKDPLKAIHKTFDFLKTLS